MLYQRAIIDEIKPWLKEKETIILNGPRQVGKTSILELLRQDLLKQGLEKTIFYLNLEEINVLGPLNENPERLLEYIINSDKKNYFLIDEIQYLDNPSNFLKHLYDKYNQKIKIICTGSSSLELKAKFQDSLAGRKITFNVLPLSFEEFLIFKKSKIYDYRRQDKVPPKIEGEFRKLLDEFLLYGGMPAVVLKNDVKLKKDLLSEYTSAYINKDIRHIGKIDDILKFNQLVKLLSVQIGNLLNVNEISNTLGLARRKVETYINLLENTFVLIKTNPYYKNVRSQIIKMPKFYWFDLGIRNQLLSNFSSLDARTDSGALFENFIFNELRSAAGKKIFFYRTTNKSEVDFVVEQDNKVYPLEVKYMEISKPLKTRALKEFSEQSKSEKGKLINLNYNYTRGQVEYLDFRRFILLNPAKLVCQRQNLTG